MRLLSFSLLCVVSTVLRSSEQHVDNNIYNQFSADIYKEVKESHEGNCIASPVSMQTILAIFYSGSNSPMSQELGTALHLPSNIELVQETFKQLTSDLHGNEKYILNSLIKLYVSQRYNINEAFKEKAKNFYNVDIDGMDFHNREEAIAEINRWMAEKTHGKITNMASERTVHENMAVYFSIGIYMKAKWRKPFNPGTYSRKFYINNEKKTEVPMFSTVARYNYYESDELEAKFLEMPFEGEDLSMTFVLPHKREDLKVLEEKIHSIFTEPNYVYQRIKVEIPKFKIRSPFDFRKVLEKMGVRTIFSDMSEISELVTGKRFKLTSLKETIVLEMGEQGVNLAASSSVPVPNTSTAYVAEFVADHPFIYFIKFKDIVMFVGRYVSP